MMNSLCIMIMPLPPKMNMINLLCDLQQERNLLRKGVIKLLMTGTSHPWFLRDLLQSHHYEGERDSHFLNTKQPHRNKK